MPDADGFSHHDIVRQVAALEGSSNARLTALETKVDRMDGKLDLLVARDSYQDGVDSEVKRRRAERWQGGNQRVTMMAAVMGLLGGGALNLLLGLLRKWGWIS